MKTELTETEIYNMSIDLNAMIGNFNDDTPNEQIAFYLKKQEAKHLLSLLTKQDEPKDGRVYDVSDVVESLKGICNQLDNRQYKFARSSVGILKHCLETQPEQPQANDAAKWFVFSDKVSDILEGYYNKNYDLLEARKRIVTEYEQQIQALKQANMELVEKAFNVGFDEGYTSPMEINGNTITEGDYERGRKVNYDLWASEYLDDFLLKHDKR